MIDDFVYQVAPARVVFGRGTLSQVSTESERLGITRALVLATPGQRARAEQVAGLLGSRAAGIFAGAVMHTPVLVTENALRNVHALHADGIVAIGGGSTIGLGKALALRTDLPQLVIPTTYAGSEMTPILGETVDGRKVTQRSAKVLPETTVYDIDLTLSLPARVTAASGMNAIAHAVEGLYAHDANPITSLMAAEGIAALAHALPQLVDAPDDAGARRDALYGAWLCGCCLGSMAMGLHHKLCHTLGGMFGLPHAETHAVVLPYATAYNIGAAPRAMRSIASALDASRADAGLHDLARRLPLPRTLRELGMPEHGIDAAADEAVKSPYPNPRPLEHAAIRDLIAAAWSGSPLQTF